MQNILWLLAIGGSAFLITAIVGHWRKRPNTFSEWWDAEGIVWFFILIFVIVCVVALAYRATGREFR